VTAPTPADEFRLRSVALAAYGPSVVNAVGHGAVMPILALRARELGADVGTAAFVVALLAIGQLATSLPAGALVARIGERRALVGAGLVDVVAMAAASVAPSVAALGTAVVVSGATWTVFLLARQGFMIEAVPPDWRARALSTLGGSHRIGLFVGPLIGSGLIAWQGLPAVFWLAAVMSGAAAALALLMPDLGSEERTTRRTQGTTQSVLSVLHAHRTVLLTLGSTVVVIGAARALRQSVLPLWAESVGLSAADTSLVFGIAAFVDMVLFYPAGWVMDRYGRTWVAVAVVGAIAVGVLMLPLATSLTGVLAIALVMAVGNGLGSGIVMTLGADAAPMIGRSQFLGGWRLCGDIGGTGGPVLVSVVTWVAPLAVACVVTGLLGIAGTAWVGYWVRRVDRGDIVR